MTEQEMEQAIKELQAAAFEQSAELAKLKSRVAKIEYNGHDE